VLDRREAQKQAAAKTAVSHVESGMVLGLGTGSTMFYAVVEIGERIAAGALTDIVGIPTSQKTATQAAAHGIPLGTLVAHPVVDLAIDGADEVDPRLNLVKGLGGALLREKQVARVARRFVVIVDEGKLVEGLGTRAPLPVEVARDGWQPEMEWLARLGCAPVLRGGASPFVSDNHNFILDCRFANGIADAKALAAALDARAGVLAHGLFLDMASEVVVAGESGLRILRRE
jgi:ribose 5-phosphate isomerase A